MSRLQGKVAVVTGSRRGIGRAIAMALAGAGSDVAICDLVTNDGSLEAVSKEIRKSGRQCLTLQMDISQQTQVETGFKAIAEKFGKIDILVNCAGVWTPGQTLVECSQENWD